MKKARILWAATLLAAALSAMLLMTTTGAALPMERLKERRPPPQVFAPLLLEPPQAPAQEAPAAPTLAVTVRLDSGAQGEQLSFLDSQGRPADTATADLRRGTACRLVPGQDYTVTTTGGLTATFRLEENGAISNVTGAGWTDGEVLHLSLSPRCTVTVLVGTASLPEAQTLRYTLTGPSYLESRAVGREPGQTQASVVFSDLAPGTYTLTGPHGQTRQITTTPLQNAITLSLE